MTFCTICKNPLSEPELELHRTYHKSCMVCHYCKNETTDEMARKAESPESLFHGPCHERKLMEDFKNKDLPIVQEQLDLLNKFLLTAHDEIPLTLDVLYPLLRNLQQAAANVSIAINRKKDKIKIKDADAYRKHVEIRNENNKFEKRAVEEKKARLQAERLDPKLRDRRKALQGLMTAFSLTEAQANEMLSKKEGPVQ
jgi:hypothetical protein